MPDVLYIHPAKHDAEQPLLALAKRLCADTATPLSSIPNLTYRSGGKVVENERNCCATPDDFPFNLPGEDEKAFQQTLRVARRIRRSYPPHLLKMINMAHTLDPCSPMSRKPQRYAIDIGLRRFKDYYDYCQQTLAIQAGEGPWKVRGFVTRQDRSLQKMARQWNDFCAEQPSSCFRVPESW